MASPSHPLLAVSFLRGAPWLRVALSLGAALIVSGCPDTRDHGRDGGGTPPPGVDGSTPPTTPPGGLTVAIEFAAWDGGRLILQARVGNGVGADPAPLAPTNFALALSGGAELTASSGGTGGLSNPCRSELSVGAGGSVACQLVFDSVVGTPERLHFRFADRSATAPIAPCSASAPAGLCDRGRVCMNGSCAEPCSWDSPRGVCPDPGALCHEGECVGRCSPSNPFGPCDVGVCRSGTCDTSCRQVDLGGEGCVDCLLPVYEGTSPCGRASEECFDCATCPLDGWSSCECFEEFDYCIGCEAETRTLWDCAMSLCPACIR